MIKLYVYFKDDTFLSFSVLRFAYQYRFLLIVCSGRRPVKIPLSYIKNFYVEYEEE